MDDSFLVRAQPSPDATRADSRWAGYPAPEIDRAGYRLSRLASHAAAAT
jgi:hypothetical protein